MSFSCHLPFLAVNFIIQLYRKYMYILFFVGEGIMYFIKIFYCFMHYTCKSFTSQTNNCWRYCNNPSFCDCLVNVFVSFCVLVFCTGHFVIVPFNLTYLHCLQHSFFEHLFNLYIYIFFSINNSIDKCFKTFYCNIVLLLSNVVFVIWFVICDLLFHLN